MGRLSLRCSYLISLEVGSSAGRKALLAAEAFHLTSHTQGIALDSHFLAPGTHYLYIWHIIFYNKSIRKMFISEANIPSNLETPWTSQSYLRSVLNFSTSPLSDLVDSQLLVGRLGAFFFRFFFFWLSPKFPKDIIYLKTRAWLQSHEDSLHLVSWYKCLFCLVKPGSVLMKLVKRPISSKVLLTAYKIHTGWVAQC